MRPTATVLVLGLTTLGLLASLFAAGVFTPTAAADGERAIAYLSVTGEGPTAKAWYTGAPPTGVFVQEALDHFAGKGYRVAKISPAMRPLVTLVTAEGISQDTTDREHYYVILLER